MDIKKITERNREFWNKQWEINFELEERMLREEVEEMISALKRWDLVEFCDWLVDTLWVGVGSAWKWWVSPENVEKCFEEIVDSNYSKLKNIVDTNLFQFNRIKDIFIKMEEENIYLYEQHDIECIEREKCQNQ